MSGEVHAGRLPAEAAGDVTTIMSLVMAWVLTLPAAIVLAGTLFFVFRHLF